MMEQVNPLTPPGSTQRPERLVFSSTSTRNPILPEPRWFETCRNGGMDPSQFSTCEEALEAFVTNLKTRNQTEETPKHVQTSTRTPNQPNIDESPTPTKTKFFSLTIPLFGTIECDNLAAIEEFVERNHDLLRSVKRTNSQNNDEFFTKNINIPVFDGLGDAEQATEFLDAIKATAFAKRIPLDEMTEHYVACYLKGLARRWFGDLPLDTVRNWKSFELSFAERFGLTESEIMHTLMNFFQGRSESTFDYVMRFYDLWLRQSGVDEIRGLDLLKEQATHDSLEVLQRIDADDRAVGIRDLYQQVIRNKIYLKNYRSYKLLDCGDMNCSRRYRRGREIDDEEMV